MAMNQEKKDVHGQVEYRGRWVDKAHFRAFVYSTTEQKLANSYNEYQKMLSSGLWFDSKEDAILATNVKIEEPVIESIEPMAEEEVIQKPKKATKSKVKQDVEIGK